MAQSPIQPKKAGGVGFGGDREGGSGQNLKKEVGNIRASSQNRGVRTPLPTMD